ncbi:MAG: ATP-dependent DNA ligase [Nanoarchaeota archaeon]
MQYAELVRVYDVLVSTTKRLEKTRVLSLFLQKIPVKFLKQVVYLLQGTVFPAYSKEKIGVADRLILKALSLATGASENELEKLWKKSGDLGEVAKRMIERRRQRSLFIQVLSVDKIFDNITCLVKTKGGGSVDRKMSLIAELLTAATPNEAKYVVRTVLGDLRVGVGDGVLRDAMVWAFLCPDIKYSDVTNSLNFNDEERDAYNLLVDGVQSMCDISNDFADVAFRLREFGKEALYQVPIRVGIPLKVMLFQKADSISDAFEKLGRPCAFEYKYDGFRLQIHKNEEGINLFTRRLEDVTAQFPDVVAAVKRHVQARECILDAEVVGYDKKTNKYTAFQHISKRIKRKYDIKEVAEKFPVEVNVFDIISVDDKVLLQMSFEQRRKRLEAVVHLIPRVILPSKMLLTSDDVAAQEFYHSSLRAGNEGVMAKALNALYKPGVRVGFGVKIKPVMDALDLVIVGAQWGKGKRAGWLTSFTVACQGDDGSLLEIGKIGTGIKEKEEEGVSFKELTDLLQPLIISESGRDVLVKPEIVIEVEYEEIQISPTYASGYALRFPRLKKLRNDKPISDVSQVSIVKSLVGSQRGRLKKG